MSKIIAKAFAQSVFTGLAAAYGGHSQVPTKSYGEAAIGQLNNNFHWHSGVSQAQVLEFYTQIIDQVIVLVDDYWSDWEGCEAMCIEIRETSTHSILEFLNRNF